MFCYLIYTQKNIILGKLGKGVYKDKLKKIQNIFERQMNR